MQVLLLKSCIINMPKHRVLMLFVSEKTHGDYECL